MTGCELVQRRAIEAARDHRVTLAVRAMSPGVPQTLVSSVAAGTQSSVQSRCVRSRTPWSSPPVQFTPVSPRSPKPVRSSPRYFRPRPTSRTPRPSPRLRLLAHEQSDPRAARSGARGTRGRPPRGGVRVRPCRRERRPAGVPKPGDEIVIPLDVYGGTYRILTRVFAPLGCVIRQIDCADSSAVASAIGDRTRLVWVESPTNPRLLVYDIAAIAAAAHAHGALVVVDNTFATPLFQQPFSLGADIVVHSVTKYLGGHSDLIQGAVLAKDGAVFGR